MELNQLRSFAAVAKHRHFTRAAEELHIGQPAVSQHVRKLEKELGLPLLARTSRSVELTEAGEILLARVEHMLSELDTGLDELAELRGLRRGRLTVGAMQSLRPFDLAASLATYRNSYPYIDVSVVEGPAGDLIASVLNDQLDLAFTPLPRVMPEGLEMHPLFSEHVVAIVSKSSPLAAHQTVDLADLRNEPFVFLQGGTGLRTMVERAAETAGFTPRAALETNELTRVVDLVAQGLGVSVVSPAVAADASDRVHTLILRPGIERRVALVWRSGRRLSPAAAAYREQIRSATGYQPDRV